MACKQSVVFLLAAAAACLLLSSPSAAVSFENCKRGKSYPVKVSSVEIKPDPIKRGEPATFKISASTDKTISKGKLIIDVTYFFFHVASETHDICGETSCPASGEFVLAHNQTLPALTPPGNYYLTMKMLGAENEELSCIDFGFSIWFIAPVALS